MKSKTEMHGPRRTMIATLAVLVIVTCIDATVLYRTRDRHLGVNEDHFDKGVMLYETGAMLPDATPSVFRPPGYPVFVAATLAVREAAMLVVRPLVGDLRPRGLRLVAVLAAHAALLGVLGAAVFWFAFDRAGPLVAAACAVGVGCNPLLLVIAGHVSYPVLHIVILTIATLMLVSRAGVGQPGAAAMFGNGLVWGAATLVKSVTLIAPPFILLWASLHYGVRKAAGMTALFAAGLILVVAPYTLRNYVVTGRFIPVNAQAGFALWATTLERIPPDANYLPWVKTWFASGMKTFTEVTGEPEYTLAAFEQHALELGDRFSAMAGDNFRRDPTVYAYNALHNGFMFVVDQPTSFWFSSYPFVWPLDVSAARFVAGLSIGMMTLIGLVATVIGCVQRDPRWTLIVALFAMMCAAHALTFLEARYLYIKLPTVIVGFVLACVVASANGDPKWRRGAVSVAMAGAILSLVGLLAL